jgi:4-hydroxy-tetrahydrodipicolinate synthase
MSPGRFGAVLCAMVTPFDDAGRLDLEGAGALAKWLVDQGNDGIVLSGSTGESATLTDGEKRDLWRAVREAVTVPVVAGTGTADTGHTVELTRAATDTGVDGILLVTPYYNRPSQAGIDAHVRAVAGATRLPIYVYDIPVRTGRKIATETMLRLATDGVIHGVKDATANPAATAGLIARAPAGFEVYSGNDGDTLPLLAVGAVGVISVEAHWAAAEMADMVGAFFKGDVDRARALNARLLASHTYQSSEDAPNPVPTKAMLRHLGQPGGDCRLPMGPAPAGIVGRAGEVLSQLRSPRG